MPHMRGITQLSIVRGAVLEGDMPETTRGVEMRHHALTSLEQDELFHQWLEGIITNREFVEATKTARKLHKEARERVINRRIRHHEEVLHA